VFQAALATLFLTPIILTIAKFMSIFMPESSSQWLKQPSRAMDMLLLIIMMLMRMLVRVIKQKALDTKQLILFPLLSAFSRSKGMSCTADWR
jgi:hypothetical protein